MLWKVHHILSTPPHMHCDHSVPSYAQAGDPNIYCGRNVVILPKVSLLPQIPARRPASCTI